MNSLPMRLSLTGATLLALAPMAHAVQPPPDADARTLDEVVVTAEREPGNFAIDRDEIELTQAADLGDLLSNESGVAVGGGSTVAQKVYVRGFEDTLLNVTVDGAQQPAELYHHQTRVQVEPEFIRSIELDAGAGAATAGAGALTGTMRVNTRNAFDMLAPGRDAGMLVKGAAGFNGQDHHKAVVATYARVGANLGLMATHVRHDGGDYDDGNGQRVSPTAFDHERSQVKLNGQFNAHSFDLSAERLDDTGTYYERPHMTNFNGRFQLSDHRMRRDTLSYNHRYNPASAAVDVRATAYRNDNRYQNRRNNTGLLYSRGEQVSTGIDLRNTTRLEAVDLVYGIDYRRDELRATQQATPPPFWGSTQQTARVFGAYVQGDWRPSASWLLSAGVRWDDYRHEVDAGVGQGASNAQSRPSPNLAIEWRPSDHLSLRAAYAQAFRGVTIREAFFSALYTHHGDLEGERADNVELGFAYERDGWYLRATGFRQHIDNYIAAVYTGGAEWGHWDNIGQAEVDGYELEAGKDWEQFGVGLGVWNSDNRFDDRPLNDADLGLGTGIGRTWTARVDWRSASGRSRYGLRARRVEDEANSIAPGAPDKPGYAVVDAMANWQLLADGRLVLGVALNNLFDRHYYDHATYGYNAGARAYVGFPASGRELVTSISYRF